MEFSPWQPSPGSRLKHGKFVVTMWAWPSQVKVCLGSISTVPSFLPLRLCPSPAVSHVKFSLVTPYSLTDAGPGGSQTLSQPSCLLLSY